MVTKLNQEDSSLVIPIINPGTKLLNLAVPSFILIFKVVYKQTKRFLSHITMSYKEKSQNMLSENSNPKREQNDRT